MPTANPTNAMTKSRKRVADFGEVFTGEREVKAMLDLVKHETYRIDSRFLDPACGTGNFLIETLRRKLSVVGDLHARIQLDYERNAFTAVASIYGIEILEDNVCECRARLLAILSEQYEKLFRKTYNPRFYAVLEFVLSKNIIHGDTLAMHNPDTGEPIVFSEWVFALESKVKRKEYTLSSLVNRNMLEGETLLSDSGKEVYIPTPIRVHPLTDYMEFADVHA